MGLEAEITMARVSCPAAAASCTSPSWAPAQPGGVAAIAGQIAASGANIDRIDRLADRPVTCIELDVSGADPDGLRAALAREAAEQGSTWRSSAAGCTGGPCGSSSWTWTPP